jgi:nucleoside 2-deoxyribosyltransferase
MKIYVTHATCFDYIHELYRPLQDSPLNNEHTIIVPHEKNQQPIDSLSIIKSSDLVIAEVSYPSTGQGIELGWANVFEIPIMCFYKKGTKFSSSLHIVTNQLFEYQNHTDLIEQLLVHIHRYCEGFL